jgi:hypothetical protein
MTYRLYNNSCFKSKSALLKARLFSLARRGGLVLF